MKLFVITKTHFVEDEDTTVSLVGVVTEDEVEETLKVMKKEILKEFEENYEEDDLKDLEFTETSTSVRGFFNCSYDEILVEATECKLNEIDAYGIYDILP